MSLYHDVGLFISFHLIDPDEKQENMNESLNQSDKESSISAGTVNDEFRAIKESKAVISEKNVPKTIKCLRRAVLLLFLICITIACNKGFYQFAQLKNN